MATVRQWADCMEAVPFHRTLPICLPTRQCLRQWRPSTSTWTSRTRFCTKTSTVVQDSSHTALAPSTTCSAGWRRDIDSHQCPFICKATMTKSFWGNLSRFSQANHARWHTKFSRRGTGSNLPMAMKYRTLKESYKKSVGVYRSHIHGRGLFCTRDIEAGKLHLPRNSRTRRSNLRLIQGEMVIEYAGELIRSTLTDKRERYYDSKGIGCYMFKIDDNLVVDATMSGTAARFINHSCDVSETRYWSCHLDKDRVWWLLKLDDSGEHRQGQARICHKRPSQMASPLISLTNIASHDFLSSSAELLLKGRWYSRSKAHHHLRSPADRDRWRVDIRLQIRHRRQQDSMWLRRKALQKVHELSCDHHELHILHTSHTIRLILFDFSCPRFNF